MRFCLLGLILCRSGRRSGTEVVGGAKSPAIQPEIVPRWRALSGLILFLLAAAGIHLGLRLMMMNAATVMLLFLLVRKLLDTAGTLIATRAFALIHQGRMDGAMSEFWEALRLKPNNPIVRDNLARAMVSKNNLTTGNSIPAKS